MMYLGCKRTLRILKLRLQKTLRPLAIICIIFTGSGHSGVQAADLSEIYNLAVKNDPQLQATEAVFLSQDAVVGQGRSLILPTIVVRGTTSHNRRVLPAMPSAPAALYNDHSWRAILTQPIFRLEGWYQFKLAKTLRAEALAKFSAEQQALIIRVAESYFNILDQEASLSAANAEHDAVQRQLEQAQQRFDVGLVAITDLLEARAAYDSTTVTVIQAENGQATSFEPLLRLTGSNFEQVYGLSEDFPVNPPEPRNEADWVKTALEYNYQLISAKEQLHSAERGVQIAKSRHYPTIDAEVTYGHSVAGSINIFSDSGSKTNQTTMSLNINVPIFQGGLVNAQIKEAAYQLEAAQQNFDLTQRLTVESTRNLYATINADVARVRARRRGIESSQSALEATQTSYEVGSRNIVDVLVAQERLYQSQRQYASARYQYIQDTLRLKQVAGTLNPQDIYDLNQFIERNTIITRTTPTTQ